MKKYFVAIAFSMFALTSASYAQCAKSASQDGCCKKQTAQKCDKSKCKSDNSCCAQMGSCDKTKCSSAEMKQCHMSASIDNKSKQPVAKVKS
jgi:hypothetical protein